MSITSGKSAIIIVFIHTALFTACTGKIALQHVRWDASSPSSQILPKGFEAPAFKPSEIEMVVGDETVTRSPQRVGAAVVEDSYLQKIYGKDGQLKYIVAEYDPADHDKLLPWIHEMDSEKHKVFEKLKKRFGLLRNALVISEPKVVIKRSLFDPTVYYEIEFVPHDGSAPQRWTLTKRLSIIKRYTLGHAFDAKAWVFPRGPTWSTISEVNFLNLEAGSVLHSKQLRLTTLSDQVASPFENEFRFDINDPRFDQVQTYHYVQWGLKLFSDQLGLKLPFKLEVKTHVGSPGKSNTMLYFRGNILLGEGDQKEFHDIMKDPTVVLHETSHAFIDALAGLSSEGETGSINEGFADFFSAHFLDHSRMGESSYLKGAFVRDLENDRKVRERNGKLYQDSLIVSGTLWKLRKVLTPSVFAPLAPKFLIRLGARGTFAELGKVMKLVIEQELSESRRADALTILRERQWIE